MTVASKAASRICLTLLRLVIICSSTVNMATTAQMRRVSMALGSTTPLLDPSPAAKPLAEARTAATNTAANVATFVQSTRGVVVNSAVAIEWWYDWGGPGPPAGCGMLSGGPRGGRALGME